MRIAPPSLPLWSAAISAQLAQTVVLAASHRSSATDRPVEAVAPTQEMSATPRPGPHIVDIRV